MPECKSVHPRKERRHKMGSHEPEKNPYKTLTERVPLGVRTGVEQLRSQGIYIDHFPISPPTEVKLALSTHQHRDHRPKHFSRIPYPIYCSHISSWLMPEAHCIVLEPNSWLTVNGIPFYNFVNVHCPGSLSFYFPNHGQICWLGDTRITPLLLRQIRALDPKLILFDNTHEALTGMQPAIETSAILLQHTIQERLAKQAEVTLCLPHIGTILLLQQLELKVKVCTGKECTVKEDVLHLLMMLDLIDPESRIVAVGIPHEKDKVNIMGSSMWFMIHKQDPTKTVQEGSLTRIFVSFHAGQAELALLSDYPLESLQYKEPP